MKKSLIYSYSDGSGNTFIINCTNTKTLEYKPVKPEFSSSGIYDGGEYIKKQISNIQFENFKSEINKAVENKEIHIEKRVMMSGLIKIKKGDNETTYIIKPGSKEQIQIEKLLKEFLK